MNHKTTGLDVAPPHVIFEGLHILRGFQKQKELADNIGLPLGRMIDEQMKQLKKKISNYLPQN